MTFEIRPVGVVRSSLTDRSAAPRQGSEGAPDAWIELEPWALDALLGVKVGDALIVLTWLHLAKRETMRVHPRNLPENEIAGVFATPPGNRTRS